MSRKFRSLDTWISFSTPRRECKYVTHRTKVGCNMPPLVWCNDKTFRGQERGPGLNPTRDEYSGSRLLNIHKLCSGRQTRGKIVYLQEIVAFEMLPSCNMSLRPKEIFVAVSMLGSNQTTT